MRGPDRVKNPIDAFLLRKLEQEGLGFSPQAARLTLIRRVYFDLTGLPPEPEEVKELLADKDPGYYEKLVDRLLESPRYGERWGRHWLDIVGYADSEGGKLSADVPRPHAYRYRDYVIRSFNAEYREYAQSGNKRIKLLEINRIPEPKIRALWDRGVPPPAYMLPRGEFPCPGQAEPHTLEILEQCRYGKASMDVRARAKITSHSGISASHYLRPLLNREILNVGLATPAVSLDRSRPNLV